MPKNEYKNLNITKEMFLEKLEEVNGNCYRAYTELGLPYKRFDRWREEDEDFANAVEKIKRKTTQWVEDVMFAFIKGEKGDPQSQARMTQFYLRAHGYADKKEITLDSKNVIDVGEAIDSIKQELEAD